MMKMQMEEQFNKIAETYDQNRRKFIPCFHEFYDRTTDFIAGSITAPKRILDLGAGTGILSSYWFKHFRNAEFLLVDIAEDMLDIAKRRFSKAENVHFLKADYQEEGNLIINAAKQFDTVISALSIHHLEDSEKQMLFKRIFDALPEGGIFVNYDQFCVNNKKINSWYTGYWENQVLSSGLSEKDIEKWRERQSLDRECSVEDEVQMISECGFGNVGCVFCSQKFAVILAVKD